MKRKKGFTLIELLAVILILGMIALIAIPTVTNIIKESKRGAFKSSVQNVISTIESECQLEQIHGEELTASYSFTNGTVDKDLNIKGDLPQSGTITVDSSCNTTVRVSDGDFCVIKEVNSGDVLVGDIKDGECVIEEDSNGETVVVPEPVSFADDSWATIIAHVKAGNLSKYNVGDTKEIALTGFTNEEEGSNGLYTIRIANISTPAECGTSGFSQAACGFVIEFEDIITTAKMNSAATNVGGWGASEMRTYINDTIYNALPTKLKEGIISTTAVSGHGSTSGETNFTTTDKVYLLSTQEVWGGNLGYDTATSETRQLDYYASKGVTGTSYSDVIKNLNGNAKRWWIRSAYSPYADGFYFASDKGAANGIAAHAVEGVSPAFRIG